MKDIFKLGATLFGISAVAALALGATDQLTAPKIEEISIQANNEARQIVLPQATEFKKIEGIEQGIISEVYSGNENGEVVGYTVKTLPSGYGGEMEVIVGISSEGKITGVNIGSHAETPGLGSKAADDEFKGQYEEKNAEPLEVVKGKVTSENQIQAISGATITSKAVTDGVNAAIEIFNSDLNK